MQDAFCGEERGVEDILASRHILCQGVSKAPGLRGSPLGNCPRAEAMAQTVGWLLCLGNTCPLPQPPKLDRKGVLDALKGGTMVPGATFANSKVSLAIRTK